MESKEAPPHPISDASSDSVSVENASLFGKAVDSSGNDDDNCRGDSKGAVSEDEEGYVSGYEEFESELNKSAPDKAAAEENIDGTEVVLSGDESAGGDGGKEIESEFHESVEKSGVNSYEGVVEGDEVVEEDSVVDTIQVEVAPAVPGVAVVGGIGENRDGVDKEVEVVAVVEPKKVEVPSGGDAKLTGEGDYVVDTVQDEVTPAVPGVAIVGGTEERGGDVDKPAEEVVEPEKVEVDSLGDVKLTGDVDSVVDVIHVDVAPTAPGVAVVGGAKENMDVVDKPIDEVVELEKVEVGSLGDVKLTGEGDSVVDAIHVDVAPTAPGVAVVGGTEENTDVVDKPIEEMVEPEKLEVDNRDDARLTGDVDSIVDAVQVDTGSAAPGVPVVGGTKENEDVVDKLAEVVVEPEKLEADNYGDVNLTGDGDSVVDSIQDVAPTLPGVAVVGGTEENGVLVDKPEEDVVSVLKPEIVEVASRGDTKLTSEGDSVVDTIHIDKVGPGVAVVGESRENGVENIEGVGVQLVSVGGATTASSSDVVQEEVGTEPAAENTAVVAEVNPLQSEHDLIGGEDMAGVKKLEVESEAVENGITAKIHTDGDVDELVSQTNNEHSPVHADINNELTEEESKGITLDIQEIGEVEDDMGGVHPEDSMSDEEDTDGMIFGSSEAAKKFMEDLERESGGDSHTLNEQSRDIDGQIVTDSEEEEEEGETDDDGDGKELFDSAALAALLKAATGGDSNGGPITITSQDGSRLFSVERPAGLGSSLQSLRPGPRTNLSRPSLFSTLSPSGGGESNENLTDEEKKKLEKLQEIRVKFLRLVNRLGLSSEESVAAQVLYRLALLGGRQNTQNFSLDAAKRMALELEAEEGNDLDFSVNLLVLGKSGVGKSATINSVFGEDKAPIDAFQTGTVSVKEISGLVDGVKVRVVDTPGLKPSVAEQGLNRSILSSIKKFTKKNPPDVVLYVDRLDAQSRDLNDLPLLKTVTSVLGSSIWRSAIVTLTHSASAPPDGPTGNPLSYEVFVSQRSHVVQQSIGHTVGDLRMMSPSVMNPVCLVENHPSCRKNREGNKILPNGQVWRPQLLLLCYSMKILSEANALSKPQDAFDHRKLFGLRSRAPPLPYMLSSMLQSRTHPKLPSDQAGENADSDIDLDDFSDSDPEEEDEYDQLPPFKPLKKAQISTLSREQRNAYFEEFDYRVKLLQKKQWKEELRRLREFKKRGTNKDNPTDYDFPEDDPDSGAAAPVAVPLPDMALPPSFDGDNPAYRYRFLEPTSQFLARPVLDTHGWDHDCGYDGVNLEHSLAVLNRFPAVYTVQITKDKKDFTISLDSSVAAKHGENVSSMAGFDIQSMGKQLAYIFRGETKVKNLKRNKVTGGISFTLLGENVVPALKVEDQVNLGKHYTLVGSAGAVKSQQEAAYGANFELQRRETGYPIGQVQSTLSMSLIKWRGDLAVGLNLLHQLNLGRNSKVAVRAGINNKMTGQVTVRTSSSEHLSLALTAIIPAAISAYRKLFPSAAGENYQLY